MSGASQDERGGLDVTGVPSDTALLRGITAGDQAAFAALYDRYNLLAYHLAHQLIGERERAEAAVLGIFLDLWRRGNGPEPSKVGVRAWLLTSLYRAVRADDTSQARDLSVVRTPN